MDWKDTKMSEKELLNYAHTNHYIKWDINEIIEAQAEISFKAGREHAFKEMLGLPEDMAVYKSENIVDEKSYLAGKQEGIRKAIEAYEPYIKLLGKEIDSLMGLAISHGWHSNKVEAGKKCRKEIENLKQAFKKKALEGE